MLCDPLCCEIIECKLQLLHLSIDNYIIEFLICFSFHFQLLYVGKYAKRAFKCIINGIGGWHVPHEILDLSVLFPVYKIRGSALK